MTCRAPTIIVGGVELSTSEFENARDLLETVSDDGADPTLDEYTENIAGGNNTSSTTGVQLPSAPGGQPPTQTSLPTPIPYDPDSSNDKPPPGGNGNPTNCPLWDGNDYNYQLSAHFKLKDFSISAYYPNQITDYMSYTKQVRFCNLMNLAINVAEPIYDKFGPFRINSGIRNVTSTPSGVSQHITGQAMDIQFAGWNYSKYWENAAWIKDNIRYDQFIFEHSSTTGLAWYHLSFNSMGNRAVSDRTKVMTMYRNHYDSGLKSYT